MKLRHAALAVLIVFANGCAPGTSAVDRATARAKASAARAESAADKADAAASRAKACSIRAAAAAAKSERSVISAYDALARLCAVWNPTDVRASWPECTIDGRPVERALADLSHRPEVSVNDWALAMTCTPRAAAHAP